VRKKSQIIVTLTFVAAAIGSAQHVSSADVTTTSADAPRLVEIAVQNIESYVPGCTNCPRVATRTPVFSAVSDFAALAGARKIVTFGPPPNVYDYSTSAGGCAISATQSVLCWGANGAGQLGDGTTTSSQVPKVAVGIDSVTDLAASGGTTCAISGGDLFCVGLGPWSPSSKVSGTWIKLNAEPVLRVLMGTHISSSARGPICVLTSAERFKCLRTVQSEVNALDFVWVDASLGAVTDAASSQMYYPGQSNMCVLSNGQIVCGTVDNSGTFNIQKRISSGVKHTRLYLFDWGYPAVCGWSSGLLSCGNFSYTPSAPYLPPSELRVVGVVPEPLSIAYRDVDSIRRVYIIHSSGVLFLNTGFLESSTYAFGSSDSIIAPVIRWKDSTPSTSKSFVAVSGPTNSASMISGTVRESSRTLLGSRNVTVTSGGSPVIGSRVTWSTTDDPTVLQSSTSSTYTTDSAGQVRFPQMASGAVTFSVSGGRVESGAFLQTAVATVNVDSTSNIEVAIPIAPTITMRQALVRLPDGTPVPNAEIRLRNAFLTYGFSNTPSSRAAWSAQQPDATGYLSSVACAFCMVNPPTYLTDADGRSSIPTFAEAPRGAEFDATANYDDGVISQSSSATVLALETTFTFQFMQSIRIASADNIDVLPGKQTSIVGTLVDDLGQAIKGVRVEIQPVCNEAAFGGLWPQGAKVSSIGCSSGLISGATKSNVSAFGDRCSNSALSDSSGKVAVRVCAKSSSLVRLSATGNLPSLTVCLRVKKMPCQSAFQQISAEEASTSVLIGRKSTSSARRVALAAGLKVPKGSTAAIAPLGPTGISCAYSKSGVTGRATGFCRARLTVTPKSGKSKTTAVLLRVP
jgi:hypothetical protein